MKCTTRLASNFLNIFLLMKRDFHIITVCIPVITSNWSGFYISISYCSIRKVCAKDKNYLSARNGEKAILICLLSLHLLWPTNKCVIREKERREKVFNMRLRCRYLKVFLLSSPVKKVFCASTFGRSSLQVQRVFQRTPCHQSVMTNVPRRWR